MFRSRLSLLYILFFSIQSFAQTLVPNSGFENWQDFDTLNQGHQLPSKWTAANTDTLFMLGNSGIVRKSSYAARGSYSVQMVIDSSNNLYDHETLQNTFPFKGRPNSLRFFASFDQPGNSATATIILYASDTNSNWKPVGSGVSTFGYTQSGWVEQAFSIFYTDTVMPARCHIAFDYPSNGSGRKDISFYFDEISFSTSTGFLAPVNKKDHGLFPCPANEELNLNLVYPATVQIVDLLGKSIYSRIFAPGLVNLATDNLPSGFYTLYIAYTNGQTETNKIIINHP